MANPFSDSDFDRLLREERNSSRAEGWKQLGTSDGVEVWRKVEQNCDVHLVKAFLDLPGVPPDHALELLYNLDIRRKYDTLFQRYEVLESHDEYRVTYATVKFPPGTWDRDLVQYNTKRSRDGEHIIVYKNAVHPARPENPNFVRAETIFSGSIIRPHANDPKSSTLTVFLQTDVKGWIPSTLMNYLTAQSPGPWRKSILSYYHDKFKQTKTSPPEAD